MDEMRTASHQRNGQPKAGYSVSYRLLILMILHESLALAVRGGAIPANPALSVARPAKHARKTRRAKRALSPAQVAILRECVAEWEDARGFGPRRGPQLRLAIELGLATGCRIARWGSGPSFGPVDPHMHGPERPPPRNAPTPAQRAVRPVRRWCSRWTATP